MRFFKKSVVIWKHKKALLGAIELNSAKNGFFDLKIKIINFINNRLYLFYKVGTAIAIRAG